ncbi:MAG: erythromycin esterase family protein, partial [Candidatus Dormibacteraceae bacterium]
MGSFSLSPTAGCWSFDVGGGRELSVAVSSFIETLGSPPELLALGEPTHGEPAFPYLRNRIFKELVNNGFRSIAIESDCVVALKVDAFVQGDDSTLDSAMVEGFSHGFGQLDANRELVAWVRAYNDSRPFAERLRFYGFDAPLEMTGAPSPRLYLEHLHGYLSKHLGSGSLIHGHEEFEQLLGDDERWNNLAAQLDASKSIGASAEAVRLRVIADDLMTVLYAQAPRLVAASTLAEWHCAEVHARTALGLLRYHAQAAAVAPQAERTSRLLGVRDALMAENLLAVRSLEQHRGATFVFGNNRHL